MCALGFHPPLGCSGSPYLGSFLLVLFLLLLAGLVSALMSKNQVDVGPIFGISAITVGGLLGWYLPELINHHVYGYYAYTDALIRSTQVVGALLLAYVGLAGAPLWMLGVVIWLGWKFVSWFGGWLTHSDDVVFYDTPSMFSYSIYPLIPGVC